MPSAIPPEGDDFISRRSREKQASEERRRAYGERMEAEVWGPLRRLRVEWNAAWEHLWETLSPVWRPWRQLPPAGTHPDASVIAAGLKRVAAAVTEYDQIIERSPNSGPKAAPFGGFTLNEFQRNPPCSLIDRLLWVEGMAGSFVGEPPVIAASLLCLAVQKPVETVTERVQLILTDDDWRPAFGWFPFLRDNLWMEDWSVSPADPVDPGIDKPYHLRVLVDDCRRVEFLLHPGAFYSWNTSDLFRWAEPTTSQPVATELTNDSSDDTLVENDSIPTQLEPSKPDPLTAGITFLFEAHQAGRKVNVVALAKAMRVKRPNLYANSKYLQLRKRANMLFGLFEDEFGKPAWHGPNGTKTKDGLVEAVESDDD